MGIFGKNKNTMTTDNRPGPKPVEVKPEVEKPEAVEPETVKVEKPTVDEKHVPSPDDKVIDGKLYKTVGYMENGCAKFRLEEVK